MTKPFFIDKNIHVFTGDQAREALQKESDSKYLCKGRGVVKVAAERWQKAQECEKNHWLRMGIKSANDRNDYHSIQFSNYNAIKNRTFHSMLEIGCGPFTNSRIIAGLCNVSQCSLLDPLILEYLHHPFCSYSKKYLFSEYIPFLGKAVRKILPFTYPVYLRMLSRKIKIKELLSIAAETISIENAYDLVIMINVIEHCYDIELVFQKILQIMRAGALFVFEDKYYEHEQIRLAVENSYDAAHPLRVDRKVIDDFLRKNFEVMYKRIQTNTMEFAGETILWDDVYYIGRRI
jgi:SAM-dependent methyltransferase